MVHNGAAPKLAFLDIFLVNKGCTLYTSEHYTWEIMVLKPRNVIQMSNLMVSVTKNIGPFNKM